MRFKTIRLLLLAVFISFIFGAILPKPAVAEPFLGEIRIFSFDFTPEGWAQCNGQLLPINQNQALFSLLGTTYGGNGQTTFALPDLRGRLAINMGDGHALGESAGEEAHTLTIAEIPSDAHAFASTSPGTLTVPGGSSILAAPKTLENQDIKLYAPAADSVMFSSTGGSQPHENRQPYLVVNYCICIQAGVFPSQN